MQFKTENKTPMGMRPVPEPWGCGMLALPGLTLQLGSPLGSVFEQTHVNPSQITCEHLHNPLWPCTMTCTPQVMRERGSEGGWSQHRLLCKTSRVCNWKQEKASAFFLILPLSRLLALHNYLLAGRGQSKIIKVSPAAERQTWCWSFAG